MINCINLIGLLLTVIGAAIAINGVLTTSAARIKQRWADIENSWQKNKPSRFHKLSCHIARRLGSENPLDTEDYTVEAFISNFWAFTLMLVGFAMQALAILASLGVFSCSGAPCR